MRPRFQKTMIFSALLLAVPCFMRAQEPAANQPKAVPKEFSSTSSDLDSPEAMLEQLYHRIAAIHRDMAVTSDADPASLREMKLNYARLAQEEESAAVAARSMAAYHAQLVALMRRSVEVPKHERYGDAAFRR